MKFRILLIGAFALSLNMNAQDWDYNEDIDTVSIEASVNYVNTFKVDDLLDKKRRIEKTLNKVTSVVANSIFTKNLVKKIISAKMKKTQKK